MNTHHTRNLIRAVAGPVAVAGILSGALGVAAVANASSHMAPLPQVQSGGYDTTQGHADAPHITMDKHTVAKITNAVEAKS
ncbi:MAG TPA: hypothetical protein VJR50_18400 [Mycobacterium sp.]|nr:hypothetical protein [Mycobacterium sp.]